MGLNVTDIKLAERRAKTAGHNDTRRSRRPIWTMWARVLGSATTGSVTPA